MSTRKLIKVCGMRESDNIRSVDALGVNMMGFILYNRSPRFIDVPPSIMPNSAKRVGVFVNETEENILTKAKLFELDYIQMHGDESPEFCDTVASKSGLKIIKAFSVDENFDFNTCKEYHSTCNFFIFDTACSGYGGSGVQFDWTSLEKYNGPTPFLLSGGINSNSADALNKLQHPYLAGYDLNSRFENSPALKDVELLKHFIEQIK